MRSRLSLSYLKIIGLSTILSAYASEIPLLERQPYQREFPSQWGGGFVDKSTLERDIDLYYNVDMQKWGLAKQNVRAEEKSSLLTQEQKKDKKNQKAIEKVENSFISDKPIVKDVEFNDDTIEKIRATTRELDRIAQKWEHEEMMENIKNKVISASKFISREGLPLVTGGGIATGIGYGGITAIESFAVLSVVPVAVPFVVAAVGGGAVYFGLRLGAPGFLEKLPDKFFNLFKEKEPVPEDWFILSVNE